MEKLKKSLIVWVSIYPPLTLILLEFGQPLSDLPVALRTLLLTVILVPMMTYILIPFWSKVFDQVSALKWRKRGLPASETSEVIKD